MEGAAESAAASVSSGDVDYLKPMHDSAVGTGTGPAADASASSGGDASAAANANASTNADTAPTTSSTFLSTDNCPLPARPQPARAGRAHSAGTRRPQYGKRLRAMEAAAESAAASVSPSDASAGEQNELDELSPADLLKLLNVLGAPPGTDLEAAASDASAAMLDDVDLTAAELERVLDLLGAPPNPNPMLEQIVLQGAREEAAFTCQPVREPTAAPPAAPEGAAESRPDLQQPESAGMDCPD